MKDIDINMLAKYGNQYIALSEDATKIFAAGKTVKQLQEKLERQHVKNAVITFIPPTDKFLSPLCR